MRKSITKPTLKQIHWILEGVIACANAHQEKEIFSDSI